MVTWLRHARFAVLCGFPTALALAACGGQTSSSSSPSPSGGSGSGGEGTSTVDPLPGSGTAYDGKGFIVHEWGTNTVVVSPVGEMQRGLHHEEEDLPGFVYDRLRAKAEPGAVEVKMETPVTYFYSPEARDVTASVAFPKGVLTQWYPKAASFYPLLADPQDGSGVRDPALDPHYPFHSATCSSQYGVPQNGMLDWGNVHVLARDAQSAGPDAPLSSFTWSHARAVASNPLALDTADGKQSEKFLFYRGLGNAELPAKIFASGPWAHDGGVTIQNLDKAHALGAVFVLRVGSDRAAFTVHPEGVAAGANLDEVAPSLDAPNAEPLDAYSDHLAKAVVTELDRTGLYHDESVAMVNTWRRQWFRTPGVRLLYLAPQAWTDALIPLTITPQPDAMTRVMMIRVELITPALDDVDSSYLQSVANAAPGSSDYQTAQAAARQHFAGLGRFAEPRLRSALRNFKSPDVGGLLAEIVGPNAAGDMGE